MDDKDLITYCGAYGGCCAGYSGNSVLKEIASTLGELADACGFQYWMPGRVKDFDYDEFRKGLAFFSDPESWFVCKKCCRDGYGRPDCPMRDCCRERGLDICFDCDEFPCQKIEWSARALKRADEYKKLGKDEWLKTQVERANNGFEHHTGKYYRLEIKDD